MRLTSRGEGPRLGPRQQQRSVMRSASVLDPGTLGELVGSNEEFVLERTSVGFAQFDERECLTVCNSRYRSIMSLVGGRDLPTGLRLEWLLRRLLDRGEVVLNGESPEKWVASQLRHHRNADGSHEQTRNDGRVLLFAETRQPGGCVAVTCSDVSDPLSARNAASRDFSLLAACRSHGATALWEEDWSEVKKAVDYLFGDGVTDIADYLRRNPAVSYKVLKSIRFPSFDDTAVDLYRADSRNQLARFLSPAPDSAFVAYPKAVAAFARGVGQIAIDTVDTAVDGSLLNLVETFQMPSGLKSDWSCVMTTSRPLFDPAAYGLAIQGDAVAKLHRANPAEPLERWHAEDRVAECSVQIGTSVEDNVYIALLDNLSLSICLVGKGLEILHTNAAARVMIATGDPLSVRRGKLEIKDRTAAQLLRDFVRGSAGDDGSQTVAGQVIPMRREVGQPLVIHVVPAARLSLLPNMPGGIAAAIYVSPGEAHPLVQAEALTLMFGLTPSESRVAAGVLSGQPLRNIATELKIAPATAKSHLLSVFGKTETHRQVELVRLAASLQLPVARIPSGVVA